MVTVRMATEQDIPRILELYRQLSLNPSAEVVEPSPESSRRAFAEINALPGYSLLVAEDGDIIGTITLAILPGLTHNASPFAVVEYVVVDEEHRGKGIGKLLMEYAIEQAKEAGCYKIMLTSDRRRTESHEFYKSVGFEDSACGFRRYL